MSRRIRVASDVGGTFTDSIAYDEATQTITVSKVSTTPVNRAQGTVTGLKRALLLQGGTGSEVVYVGHGMTTATNAVIQRKGARTAFVTNRGFRDILLIGRQNRPTLFDITIVRPSNWYRGTSASPSAVVWRRAARKSSRSTRRMCMRSPLRSRRPM